MKLDGTFIIRNQWDINSLSKITEITGDLIITAQGMTDVTLPYLKTVGGNITIEDNRSVSNVVLIGVEYIGGSFKVRGNYKLNLVYMPRLNTLKGGFKSNNNLALYYIDLPKLNTIGTYFFVRDNHALTDINAPKLRSIGHGCYICNNDKMKELNLPHLEIVGTHKGRGYPDSKSLKICDSTYLESVLLPKLSKVRGDFEVKGHPYLKILRVPRLTHVGCRLTIAHNCRLSLKEVGAVIKGTTLEETSMTIEHNSLH